MKILLILTAVVLILLFFYLFLVAPRLVGKPDRSSLMGRHYAHRGLFDNEGGAPENSLPAFKKAVEHGYGIELDVQLSRDGIPMVFHDASLKRMCGIDGKIGEFTKEELQKIKLAKSDAVIPTFEEVLQTVGGRVPLIVEYKTDGHSLAVCKKGNALLEQYQGPYCIESFDPRAVCWYRIHRSDVVRGQLSQRYWNSEEFKGKPLYLFLEYLLTNVMARPDFIAYCHKDAANFSRKLCRKMGALSVAWTIRSEEQFEKAKDQFDLFIFDSFILK